METRTVPERLRHARLARHEPLEALAKRIGVRESILQSIETGQFEALPRGIYARAAIRAFAAAVGLDPVATMANCEEQLTPADDPIAGLARIRGLRPHAADRPLVPAPAPPAGLPEPSVPLPSAR